MRQLAVRIAIPIALIGVACAASNGNGDGDGDGTASTDADIVSVANRSSELLYEGTCQFLHDCSSYSKKLPAGQLLWGCDGAGECSDRELWVAGPSKAYCNKHVRFCNGARCTDALVRDISISQSWEGSDAVLDRLGLDHAVVGKCGGRGGGAVKVTFPAPAQPAAPPSASSAPAPDPAPSASSASDATN